MSSTAVAERPQDRKPTVKSVVDGIQPQVARMLPASVPPDQFARATETALLKDRKLLECDRVSLFNAVMECAETGLMPNGRDAALVRYKGAVQFIPMIAGILKLMRNSGEIATIGAEVFCEHDEFDYGLGSEPFVRHKPSLDDRGEVQGAYAIVKTKDGAQYIEIMGRKDIDKVMRMSKAQNGPWSTWFEEMARKTVLRRLAKKCPLSTDRLIDLTSRDDHMYDLNAVKPQRKTSEIVGAKLRGEDLQLEDQSQDDGHNPAETSQDASGEPIDAEAHDTPAKSETKPDAAPVDDADYSFIYADDYRPEMLAGALVCSVVEAMEDAQRHCNNASDADDLIKTRYPQWKVLIDESFAEPKDIVLAGRQLFNNKRIEMEGTKQ